MHLHTHTLTHKRMHILTHTRAQTICPIQKADNWLKEIDNKEIIQAVLLDFSAAFDIIDHNLLLEKLLGYSFASPAVSWIDSYMSGRTQTVLFNGSLSNIIQVESGIP